MLFQKELFEEKSEFQKIKLQDGELWLMPHFLDIKKSELYFRQLFENIHWKEEQIKLFGKTYLVPRKTAWYGDEQCVYEYSGIVCEPTSWTAVLLEIKDAIEAQLSNVTFNSVLLNLYRNGNDKMGWHADDEKELGINPIIASVSLGAIRRFDLKHKKLPNEKHQYYLGSGSLMIMTGETQHHWLHQIPAQKKIMEPRINLTFRNIKK